MRLIDTHPRLAPIVASLIAALIVVLITRLTNGRLSDEWPAIAGTLMGTYIGVRSVAPARKN